MPCQESLARHLRDLFDARHRRRQSPGSRPPGGPGGPETGSEAAAEAAEMGGVEAREAAEAAREVAKAAREVARRFGHEEVAAQTVSDRLQS